MKNIRSIWLSWIVCLGGVFPAHQTTARTMEFGAWEAVLKTHVRPTRIDGVELNGFDYQKLSKNRAGFDRVLTRLKSFDPNGLHANQQKLAFWINVYNILAVKVVIDHPGMISLNDVGGSKGAVWKMKVSEVGGKAMSLDEIEHTILRKLKDPRMHFAIVCASVSCPDIRPEAYTPDRLDRQLDEQTQKFLANPKKGMRIDTSRRRIQISKLFEWFAADFGPQADWKDFVAAHWPKNQKAPEKWRDFQVTTFDYNWKLNRL